MPTAVVSNTVGTSLCRLKVCWWSGSHSGSQSSSWSQGFWSVICKIVEWMSSNLSSKSRRSPWLLLECIELWKEWSNVCLPRACQHHPPYIQRNTLSLRDWKGRCGCGARGDASGVVTENSAEIKATLVGLLLQVIEIKLKLSSGKEGNVLV